MAVAIWLGTFIGAGIASFLGFAGGLLGAIIVGFIMYIIYTLLTGGKINLYKGIIFAVVVWIAQMVSGVIGGKMGLTGGLLGLLVTAFIASFLWGWFGGRGAVAGTKKSGRRRRR